MRVLAVHRGVGLELGAAPLENERLADEEEHDADLRNRRKAPDRGLLLQVVGDEARHERTGQPEEDALNDHVPLHHKERRKHEERVDRRGRRPVGRVVHRNRPRKVMSALVRAKSLATQPFLSTARTRS